MNKILLSFDLEEFDIPEEYGQTLSVNEKLDASRSGLFLVTSLLDELSIRATFYTTAYFAECNPELIKKIALRHEIASHGYYHSSFKPEDVALSKTALEAISGQPVKGFRMPRLAKFDLTLLKNAGYEYNSSLNPTWIPGRYNEFTKPRNPFQEGGIFQLPASVALWMRIPLFWISFKVLPIKLYRSLALHVLNKTHYLNIYFHPWEFINLGKYHMPFYTKRIYGNELLSRLKALLLALKLEGEFVTAHDYCLLLASQTNQVHDSKI